LLKQVPSKINLIPFNPFSGNQFKQSKPEAIERFKNICMKNGLITTVRKTRGDDIAAACGQLAGDFMDRTRRSSEFKKLQLEVVA